MLKTEAQLAVTCMSYLAFDFFRPNLDTSQIQSFLKRGFYSFHLYASSHWNDHLCSFIHASKYSGKSEIQEFEEDIVTAIESFTSRYYHVSNPGPSSSDNEEPFNITDKHGDTEVERLMGPIIVQTDPEFFRTVREVGCQDINISHSSEVNDVHNMTRRIRSVLEDSLSLVGSSKEQLTSLYGSNWYYCPRTTCFYFHYGFPDAARRDQHCDRHERPYRCNYDVCLRATAGFTTEKLLKKHNADYHAEASVLKWEFPEWKDHDRPETKARRQGDHQCSECLRTFTRPGNLKVHMRQHLGVKPFACQECDKRFTHDSDRKRHEKSHTGETKYICRGKTSDGTEWGCGKAFARSDTLANHLRSDLGRKCFDARKVHEDSVELLAEKGENSSQESEQVQSEREHKGSSEGEMKTSEKEIIAKYLQSLHAKIYHPAIWARRADYTLEEDFRSDHTEPTLSKQQKKKRKLGAAQNEEYLHSFPSRGQSGDDSPGPSGVQSKDSSRV